MNEAELIAQCRRGDESAWDELFHRHYDPVGRFLFQLSPDLTREDAQELCQETFLAAIRAFTAFQGASSIQTWLFRIAINKARDHLEKRRTAKRGGGRQPDSLDAQDPETGLHPDPATPNPSPDQTLIDLEQHAQIHQALADLGDPCREILELRYFGDLAYDEIAAALDLNPKTVSSRLSKCLDRLEDLYRDRDARGKQAAFPSNP